MKKKNVAKEEHKFHRCCQVEAWPDFDMGEVNAKKPSSLFLPSLLIFGFEKTNFGNPGLTISTTSTLSALLQAVSSWSSPGEKKPLKNGLPGWQKVSF